MLMHGLGFLPELKGRGALGTSGPRHIRRRAAWAVLGNIKMHHIEKYDDVSTLLIFPLGPGCGAPLNTARAALTRPERA